MTALLDALVTPPETGVRCKVGRWVNSLAPDEHTALTTALAGEASNAVFTRLAKAGHAPASSAAWWRHWSGACRCPR